MIRPESSVDFNTLARRIKRWGEAQEAFDLVRQGMDREAADKA
jgi:hypothetical protein